MLKEIYTWFIRNLKHPPILAESHPTTDQAANQATPPMEFTFELYAEAANGVGSDVELICPNTSLHRHWALGAVKETNDVQFDGGKLFICQCDSGGARTKSIHQDRLAGIRCEFISVPKSSPAPFLAFIPAGNVTPHLRYLFCVHCPESDFVYYWHC